MTEQEKTRVTVRITSCLGKETLKLTRVNFCYVINEIQKNFNDYREKKSGQCIPVMIRVERTDSQNPVGQKNYKEYRLYGISRTDVVKKIREIPDME